ncbi:hypothetical protein HYS94_05590 [Candidatus Daviesbacteria bacterium]|nr:hypothetical protein [Candidatus Daviesbacteria bacterium]
MDLKIDHLIIEKDRIEHIAKHGVTVVVGERQEKNTYGLVTARPSSREEHSFYREFIYQIGGEENGENKTN